MVALRRRPDVEIVERDVGLPIVDGEVLVGGAGEGLGIGPGEKGLAVDGPVDGAVLAGDGEVVALAGRRP